MRTSYPSEGVGSCSPINFSALGKNPSRDVHMIMLPPGAIVKNPADDVATKLV